MSMTEAIVIRLIGDFGDGVQLVGEQLTINAATIGCRRQAAAGRRRG